MTIWGFLDNHWFLALLIICCGYGIIVRIIRLPILLLRGWPEAPMDADGDIRYQEKDKQS